MKPIVILYHNDCADGFGAAWAAWKKFGSRADYIPAFYQKPPDPQLRGKEIYLVDFSYFGDHMKSLIAANKSVTLIDHHKTAEPELQNVTAHYFDLQHSAAVLSWKFFHPSKKIPILLLTIEDGDIWKFERKGTKELRASLRLEPYAFPRWNVLAREFESIKSRGIHLARGKDILRYEDMVIANLAAKAAPAMFEGHRVGVVNSPVLQSQIGHAVYEKLGFPIAIVWSRDKERINISLRSKTIDVAKLAEKYGGGGHKLAAGIKYPADKPLPWKYIK